MIFEDTRLTWKSGLLSSLLEPWEKAGAEGAQRGESVPCQLKAR